jgi:hypothetical protein
MPLGAVRAALLGIKKGIQGILVGPTQITTSTASTATAYSNQRKIDRTSNGVLWMLYWYGSGTGLNLNYSTDDGATWSNGGAVFNGSASGTQSYQMNASFFIDQDDHAHVVFKDNSNGYIYYRRGTPNAGRTAWTWSAASLLEAVTFFDYPDLVVHREGTGWVAHIVLSVVGNTTDKVYYYPRNIASNGTITSGGSTAVSNLISSATSPAPFASIDFNHTGDGKTVAGGTPHLYVAWSAGTTGAGKGIRFKKATYSGGAWTWGTEREIDSTQYINIGTNQWLNCMFDGTRIVIAGTVQDSQGTQAGKVYDRDVADTATVTHTIARVGTNYLYGGSASYDSDGNVFFFGHKATSGYDLLYQKWVRATDTADSLVVLVTPRGTLSPHVSAKRGYSNNRIEFIYTDGTASPYNVTYGAIK